MPDNVFDFERVLVVKVEVPDPGHCKLQRDLAAARAATRYKHACLAQHANIEQLRDTRE